jgi:hypothetical protein
VLGYKRQKQPPFSNIEVGVVPENCDESSKGQLSARRNLSVEERESRFSSGA